MREKLTYSDKAAAEAEKNHLQTKLQNLKNALTSGETVLSITTNEAVQKNISEKQAEPE